MILVQGLTLIIDLRRLGNTKKQKQRDPIVYLSRYQRYMDVKERYE